MGGIKHWIPSPRDINTIEWALSSDEDEQIYAKSFGAPGAGFIVFSQTTEPIKLSIGEIKVIPWHYRCRSISQMYFEAGQGTEALFWVNVAVEALFNYRFSEFAQQLDCPDLLNELGSPKAFWDGAEEVIAAQFPEMAGKIEWPPDEIHVSIYRKLKYLHKIAPMNTKLRELLIYYRNVSRLRNELFHGVHEKRFSVDDVTIALAGFDWIDRHFNLTSQAADTSID